MEDYKKRIEAILFTTGRPMDTGEIARLCSIGSIGIINEIVGELRNDYDSKDSALTILNEDGKFKLSIRKEYNYLTTNLMNDSELDEPTTKTLALIAYKQPVLQSDIVDMRGNTAYDHIKILKELGFILSEKKGRTRLLKLAPKFFDYFDLIENEVRSKIANEDAKKLEEETNTMENSLKSAEAQEKLEKTRNAAQEKEENNEDQNV